MEISNSAVCAFVERVLDQQEGVHDVNFVDVVTRLTHGESEIFLINAYIEDENRTELRELTVSIDLKEKKSN